MSKLKTHANCTAGKWYGTSATLRPLCTPNTLWMHSQCTLNSIIMHSYCTVNAVLILPRWRMRRSKSAEAIPEAQHTKARIIVNISCEYVNQGLQKEIENSLFKWCLHVRTDLIWKANQTLSDHVNQHCLLEKLEIGRYQPILRKQDQPKWIAGFPAAFK